MKATAPNDIPFQTGPTIFTGFAAGPVYQTGQYVVLCGAGGLDTGNWISYTSNIDPNNLERIGNRLPMMYGQVTAYDPISPSLSVNVLYYKSCGQGNMVTSGESYYIHSAFPFLLRQQTYNTTATVYNVKFDANVGYVNGGTTWRVPEIGLIFDGINGGVVSSVSPIVTLTCDMVSV